MIGWRLMFMLSLVACDGVAYTLGPDGCHEGPVGVLGELTVTDHARQSGDLAVHAACLPAKVGLALNGGVDIDDECVRLPMELAPELDSASCLVHVASVPSIVEVWLYTVDADGIDGVLDVRSY